MKKRESTIIVTIDTSRSEATSVGLIIDGKRFEKVSDARQAKSQILLPLIEQILQEEHITFDDIGEIRVHVGPGSFTGLRVGVSVAQMLGKLLSVPVNGKPVGETRPDYQESKWE